MIAYDPNTLLISEYISVLVYPFLMSVLTTYRYSLADGDSKNSMVELTDSVSRHLIPLNISSALI